MVFLSVKAENGLSAVLLQIVDFGAVPAFRFRLASEFHVAVVVASVAYRWVGNVKTGLDTQWADFDMFRDHSLIECDDDRRGVDPMSVFSAGNMLHLDYALIFQSFNQFLFRHFLRFAAGKHIATSVQPGMSDHRHGRTITQTYRAPLSLHQFHRRDPAWISRR